MERAVVQVFASPQLVLCDIQFRQTVPFPVFGDHVSCMLQLFPGDKQIQRVRYSEEVKRPTLVRALIPIRFLDVDSLLRHFASCSCSCHSFLLLSAALSHTCFLWPRTPTTRQYQLFLPLSARSARSILRREDDFIRPDPRERTLRRLRHIASHAAD